MGESRSSKETRKRLEERDRTAEAERVRLTASAEKDSPLKTAVEDSRLGDIEYFNQQSPDYTRPPAGMVNGTAFQQAALNRLRSRTGVGAAGMGAYGANPNLLALSREHEDAGMAERGAGEYASALAARRAEAYGGADASIGLNVSRALQLAGMSSQTAQSSSTNLANYHPAPSFWAQAALAGIGAAGAAGSAYLGRSSKP